MKEDLKYEIAITWFCYGAATYFNPFGHLSLKSSNLQKQETILVSGTLLCSSSSCTKTKTKVYEDIKCTIS